MISGTVMRCPVSGIFSPPQTIRRFIVAGQVPRPKSSYLSTKNRYYRFFRDWRLEDSQTAENRLCERKQS
jgi:hypothetical protein